MDDEDQEKVKREDETTEQGEDDADEDMDDEEEEDKKKPSQWPWESVRNKLRNSLTEMSVLADVIAVSTKECGKEENNQPKRYMVLDGPVKADQPDSKPLVQMLAKKKSLDIPAKILSAGAEHLRTLQNSQRSSNATSSQQDFHLELLRY